MASSTTDKLKALRGLFDKHNIGFYLVLTQDEHHSEYVSDADQRREFISGFTGSAGTAIIGRTQAGLATDGRYFLQAGKELDANWELLKQGVKGLPAWTEWVAKEAAKGNANIGVDPKFITYGVVERIRKLLKAEGSSADVVAINENLVDEVWGPDKPKRSRDPVFHLDDKYTGKTVADKLGELRAEIKKAKGTAFVVSALDDVAWLLNLRGFDIPFNPVFFAYVLVTLDKATLYIDDAKPADVAQKLAGLVDVRPYDAVFDDARKLGVDVRAANEAKSVADQAKLLVPDVASWAMLEALGGPDAVTQVPSIVEALKAVKNSVELAGQRQAQVYDGAAVTRYLAWLEQTVKAGTEISDYDASEKSQEFRAQMPHFQGLSFNTISSSGPMAAVIHYAPAKDSKEMVRQDQVYLLDSGGQYDMGTTDTTRTHHFGTPRPEEIRAYTLVLKGHIALAQAVFPEGTNGYMLDTLARQFLWRDGLDYRHGTGHGVGAFLNVHEGPVGIGFRPGYLNVPLKVGHVISNEPGFYEDGKFGIRIESLVVVKEVETPHKFGGVRYLGFETVTQVPLCPALMDLDLLTPGEIKWINEYHAQVAQALRPHVEKDPVALEWLERNTKPL